MRRPAIVAAALAFGFPAIAFAQGPEQIDQLEPGDGEWQAEYFGTFGPGGDREHALEAMFGLTGRLAVGVELEAEYSNGALSFDTVGLKALYRLTRDEAPLALGLQVQLDFDSGAALAQAEARLIAEVQSDAWWAQGNVMLRRSSDGSETPTRLAYAFSLQRSLGDHVWLGVEGSGQSAPLWGGGGAGADSGHFAGPSVTVEWQLPGDREIELGLAWFRRVGGAGPRDSARFFVQVGF
jgi:hypothetical protein